MRLLFFSVVVFFTPVVCLTFSCQNKTLNDNLLIKYNEINDSSLSNTMELESYTCLKDSLRPFIGEINKIQEFRGDYFILDRYYNKGLYVFNKSSGDFKFKIGFYGEGPGGYSEIYDFFIDEKSQYVEVLSIGKILRFDIKNGNYLESYNIDFPAVRFLKDTNNYYFVLGAKNKQFLITDLKFKPINTYFPFSIMHSLLPENSLLFGSKNKILFHRNFENKIYLINHGKIENYLTINFDERKLDDRKIMNIKYPQETFEVLKSNSLKFKFFYDTKNHFIFPFIKNKTPFIVFWNKQKKIFRVFNAQKVKNDLTFEEHFPNIIGINNKGNLLCYVSVEEVKNNQPFCQNALDYIIVELSIKKTSI